MTLETRTGQLYKVTFRSCREGVIENGSYLVCATSGPAAEAAVIGFANPPSIGTEYTTIRVKPSIYELSRHEFREKPVIASQPVVNKRPHEFGFPLSAVLATEPPELNPLPKAKEPPSEPALLPEAVGYTINVTGLVVARSESVSLRRLAQAIIENASAQRAQLPPLVKEMSIEISAVQPGGPRRSRIEEQGNYKHPRFFEGGATRGR